VTQQDSKRKNEESFKIQIIIIIIIIIIGSTAQGGSWPPEVNVASDLYLSWSPTSQFVQIGGRLPLSRQPILISVDRVLVDLQSLSITSF